jgi:hypothetical protein
MLTRSRDEQFSLTPGPREAHQAPHIVADRYRDGTTRKGSSIEWLASSVVVENRR